jgi:hypothetical protein
MVMGQGVGTAAALALRDGMEMHEVAPNKLQETLRADGAFIEDVPEA